VLAKDGGRVADENTATDDHGTVTHAHLVVRVPSSTFNSAMTSLSEIASLRSASRKAEDVTTQVIDLQARIAAERAGVRRLRALVSQTANLRALLDVERALTERQGELESLRQQQAYLADRSSLATITVDVALRTTRPRAGRGRRLRRRARARLARTGRRGHRAAGRPRCPAPVRGHRGPDRRAGLVRATPDAPYPAAAGAGGVLGGVAYRVVGTVVTESHREPVDDSGRARAPY
jgi:hypothetical protein